MSYVGERYREERCDLTWAMNVEGASKVMERWTSVGLTDFGAAAVCYNAI